MTHFSYETINVTQATSVSLRIYHEDTDSGGVVYHANYLRYMERARTEWLHAQGFDHERIEREYGILFVVRSVDIKYLRPARLGDYLEAWAEPRELRRGLLTFEQTVRRADEVLAQARVRVISVALKDFKSTDVPLALARKFGFHGDEAGSSAA